MKLFLKALAFGLTIASAGFANGESIRLKMRTELKDGLVTYGQMSASTTAVQYAAELSTGWMSVDINNGESHSEQAIHTVYNEETGYSHLRFEKISSTKLKITEVGIGYQVAEGRRYGIPYSYEGEAVFASGNWESFLAGGQVRINLTPQTEARFDQISKDLMARTIKEQMRIQFPSHTVSTEVESFNFTGNGYVGTKESLSAASEGVAKLKIVLRQ